MNAKVTTVYVRADYVICPNCGERVGGWLGDPRGKEEECDECGQPFTVDNDADLEMSS